MKLIKSVSDAEQTSKSSKIHNRQRGALELFGANRTNAVLGYNCKGIVNHTLKRLYLLCTGSKLGGLKQKYVLHVEAPASPWGEIELVPAPGQAGSPMLFAESP